MNTNNWNIHNTVTHIHNGPLTQEIWDGSNGETIATVRGNTPEALRSRIKLTAAAPDLLAALQNCLSAFETHIVAGQKLSDHYSGRIERAREAIAKATQPQ